jgi:hypothetical protein
VREIKTKETALKHIRAGKRFHSRAFYKFRADKEVCWEAIVHGVSSFHYVRLAIPGIEWDSEYVESIFMKLLEVNPEAIDLSEIGPYLTPKITDSKEVAIRAAKCGLMSYPLYFASDLFLDKDIVNAYRRKADYRVHQGAFNEMKFFGKPEYDLMQNTDLLEVLVSSCPQLYWSLPESLRLNRQVSITISIHTGSFRYVDSDFQDDEEFVLKALLGYPGDRADMFKTCSYRIRKAAGHNDPIEFLWSTILSNELQASLTHKKDDSRPKINKVKI